MRTLREEIEMIIENDITRYPDGTVSNTSEVTESIIKEINNIFPARKEEYSYEYSFVNGQACGFNDCLNLIKERI